MRAVLILFVILVLLAAVLILWMAGGVQKPKVTFPPVMAIPGVLTSSRSAADPSITVVTWNIAWGYGAGSEGRGAARPKEHFERTLDEIGRVLAQLEPDVVLLQEVDFDSTRSHHIDQAERLARLAKLPYVAKAVTWRASWVPFPFWPPEDQFGTLRSGGAILSRFPIEGHRVETVSKPKSNPFWYNLFYLFRYHQQATLQTEDGPVLVLNVHAEAFEKESRIRHARLLADRISSELIPRTIVGGDLNTVLPEATVRRGYPDEPETSHVDDPTLELIRGIDGLLDTVPGELYLKNEPAWLTFPAHEPNRKLDYLLHGAGFRVEEVEVPRALAGELSDHLPLVARLAPIEAAPSRKRLKTGTSTAT